MGKGCSRGRKWSQQRSGGERKGEGRQAEGGREKERASLSGASAHSTFVSFGLILLSLATKSVLNTTPRGQELDGARGETAEPRTCSGACGLGRGRCRQLEERLPPGS